MKNRFFIGITILLCVVSLTKGFGQANEKADRVERQRTLMNKFEPTYVLSASEQLALEEKRIAKQKRTERILDTLSISDRKRRKLMRELKRSPFSKRIDQVIMANTQFEDIEDNDQ